MLTDWTAPNSLAEILYEVLRGKEPRSAGSAQTASWQLAACHNATQIGQLIEEALDHFYVAAGSSVRRQEQGGATKIATPLEDRFAALYAMASPLILLRDIAAASPNALLDLWRDLRKAVAQEPDRERKSAGLDVCGSVGRNVQGVETRSPAALGGEFERAFALLATIVGKSEIDPARGRSVARTVVTFLEAGCCVLRELKAFLDWGRCCRDRVHEEKLGREVDRRQASRLCGGEEGEAIKEFLSFFDMASDKGMEWAIIVEDYWSLVCGDPLGTSFWGHLSAQAENPEVRKIGERGFGDESTCNDCGG